MQKVIEILGIINANWSGIIVVVGLALLLFYKIKNYIRLTPEEKIEIAKKAIRENILSYVADAELNWVEFVKAGVVKRSEVINRIYADYPILKECIDQDEIIKFIDDIIDDVKPAVDALFNTNIVDKEV